jgi:drug/metabolite transporter (DMT)-like permease
MKSAPAQHELSGGLTGIAFLFGNILCWSAVPVMLRHLTGVVDAWTANGFRYPLAGILYWPILIVAWRSNRLDARVVRRCLVPSSLALVAQVFWAIAPYHLPATAIGFFVRLSLLWSLIAAMILFRDERKLLKLPSFHAGLGLLVIGFLLLSVSKLRFDADVTSTGIVIILLCAFFFGLYAVSVRYFMGGINPMVSFGVVCQFVSAGTLIAMLMFGNYQQLAEISALNWLLLVMSAILGIALGHHFLYSAVTRLGAAVTSGAQTLAPFLTILLAATFLGESMSAVEWFGGILMVIGAGMLLVAQNQLVAARRRT